MKELIDLYIKIMNETATLDDMMMFILNLKTTSLDETAGLELIRQMYKDRN